MNGKRDQPAASQIWNIPNRISLVRLGLSVLLFAAITLESYVAAFILFVIAAGSDWIDGWWARRYGQITQLGRILDPFCDKILICGTFILLAVSMRDLAIPWYAKIAGWMAVVVMAREMLVTALRGFMEQTGRDFSAKLAGKIKMWLQSIAAGAGLMALVVAQRSEGGGLPNWLIAVLAIFIWSMIASTLQSSIGYIRSAWQVLCQSEPNSN